MPTDAPDPTSSQINKAGLLMRDVVDGLHEDREATIAQLDHVAVGGAIDAIEAFRARHAYPLAKVNANLRYWVRKAGKAEPEVSQRLKRYATIVGKLRRQRTMKLARMEDIAGVRAVLQNQAQADEIRDHLVKAPRWDIRRVRDYAHEDGDPGPKSDGYRAIHVIVKKDGCYVEIQLRTPWQDTWAQSVEQDTRRLRAGLKFGSGPDDLRTYYVMVSEYFVMRERDEEPDQDFMEELAKLYSATRRWFPGDTGE